MLAEKRVFRSQLGLCCTPVLVVLTNSQHRPIARSSHHTPNRSQPARQLQHLALDLNQLTLQRRPKVRNIEIPRHARVAPMLFASKDSHACRVVEERCYRAAVDGLAEWVVAA